MLPQITRVVTDPSAKVTNFPVRWPGQVQFGLKIAQKPVLLLPVELDLHWINLLILFGALQGLIAGIILLFNRKHPGARFLSAFVLVLAYNGFETFNWSAGPTSINTYAMQTSRNWSSLLKPGREDPT